MILHGNGNLTRDWASFKLVSIEPQTQYFQTSPSSSSQTPKQPSQPKYMSCTEKSMMEVRRLRESVETHCNPAPTYSSCGQFGGYMSCR